MLDVAVIGYKSMLKGILTDILNMHIAVIYFIYMIPCIPIIIMFNTMV
jgi:hypothetical protein